jgi:predicted DNA-binding transcriptional regulator YafY
LTELNKAQKLVKIVELMARRGGVRSSELMERFELDARSLRRYIADLKDLGLPLEDDGRGEDRVIFLDARWRRTGVQLSLTEVLSLHFGRKLFNFLEGTPFASDLDDAIERLEPAVSRANSELLQKLDKKFLAVPEATKNYRDYAEAIDEVVTSLIYNNPIRARYRKLSGVTGKYRLHPFTLATFRQGLYLFALDTAVSQVKTFAVERFVDVERLRNETFKYPDTWHPEAHLASAFGIISGEAVEVRLAFAERVSAYIKERSWHPTETVRTLPDGRLELRLSVALTVELETWILGFGEDVEVLGPDALVASIGERLRKAALRYGAT